MLFRICLIYIFRFFCCFSPLEKVYFTFSSGICLLYFFQGWFAPHGKRLFDFFLFFYCGGGNSYELPPWQGFQFSLFPLSYSDSTLSVLTYFSFLPFYFLISGSNQQDGVVRALLRQSHAAGCLGWPERMRRGCKLNWNTPEAVVLLGFRLLYLRMSGSHFLLCLCESYPFSLFHLELLCLSQIGALLPVGLQRKLVFFAGLLAFNALTFSIMRLFSARLLSSSYPRNRYHSRSMSSLRSSPSSFSPARGLSFGVGPIQLSTLKAGPLTSALVSWKSVFWDMFICLRRISISTSNFVRRSSSFCSRSSMMASAVRPSFFLDIAFHKILGNLWCFPSFPYRGPNFWCNRSCCRVPICRSSCFQILFLLCLCWVFSSLWYFDILI